MMRASAAALALFALLQTATSTGATQQGPASVSIALSGDAEQLPQVRDDAALDKACPPHFTREYWPVCGFDGATYRKFANKSIFAYHQCRAEKLRGAAMTLVDMRFCADAADGDGDAR